MEKHHRNKKYYIYFFLIFIFSLYFVYEAGFLDNLKFEKREKPIPVSTLSDKDFSEMVNRLKLLAVKYPGNVGIYFKDLSSNREWSYNPDRIFPSASLIKVPIMASVLDKVKKDNIDLNLELTLTKKDKRGGSGSLKWVREGTKLSLLEIMYKMITESDNTATYMLIDYFGYDYFEQEFKKLGLYYTSITPEGMSLTSGRVAKENFTTPREMAYLFEKIYKKELIDKNSSEIMLEILKRTKSRSRLKKSLPRQWEMGHKTGLLRKSCHDVGIIFSPNGDYLLAVLTSNVPDYRSAKNFITKVGNIAAAYYKIQNSLDRNE